MRIQFAVGYDCATDPLAKINQEKILDGNFGGEYEKPDEQMLTLWRIAVEETRGIISAM